MQLSKRELELTRATEQGKRDYRSCETKPPESYASQPDMLQAWQNGWKIAQQNDSWI